MGRVRLLPEDLVNQIAAGEVVERPASVIKELCENSIDAGARNIRVTLRDAGLGCITVVDDGVGMSREDAVLAMSRHATSKLRDAAGLLEILTKGFRGEAIPAIAAVSRFTLLTSEPGQTTGTRIQVDGGGEPLVEDAPAPGGTRIDVEELFFNTPARRKFMRRDQTELSHCEEALLRLALAHPEVGFHLDHAGKVLLASPACADDPRERIAAALGKEVHGHLLAVDERRLGIRVHGHIASPEYTLPTARGIYTFVNHRYIRDRGVLHAVSRAYQDSLPPGRQPVAVVFLEVDPHSVDVNVHPQKLEVRFADARGIYDAVFSALAKALKTAPWLQAAPGSGGEEPVRGAHYAHAVERFLAQAEGRGGRPLEPLVLAAAEGPAPLVELGFGQAKPGLNQAAPPGYFAGLRYLGTLGKRFLVCEGHGGTLVVVNANAAIERVRFSELRRDVEASRKGAAQRFLFAASVELPVAQAKALAARLEALDALGLAVEPFGGRSFAITAMPPSLVGADYPELLGELAEALPAGAVLDEEVTGRALAVLAGHAAALHARTLSADEAHALFEQLERAEPSPAPRHGNVVALEVPFLELERKAR